MGNSVKILLDRTPRQNLQDGREVYQKYLFDNFMEENEAT
jgi:hypothetical protein